MSTSRRRDYPSADPSRRTIGWVAVIGFHLIVGWALVTGTARKGLELIKKPIEAVVIQEVIIPPPPPPPPKEIQRAAPKTEAPPPPFVPPAEVTPPVQSQPVIASVVTPPPEPQPIAPPPPPAPPPAPAAPLEPVRAEIGVVCPTQARPSMPKRALEDGIEGVVRAQVLIRNGAVVKVDILSGPQVFRAPVREALQQYRCNSTPGDVIATQEFAFKLD